MPPHRPLPEPLARVRKAFLAQQDALAAYRQALNERDHALADDDAPRAVRASRRARTAYDHLTDTDEELNHARWEAVEAGHAFTELDQAQAVWARI